MPQKNTIQVRNVLLFSASIALLLSIWSIGMGMFINSNAILLNGIFILVSALGSLYKVYLSFSAIKKLLKNILLVIVLMNPYLFY